MNSLITSRGKVGLVEIMVNVVLFNVSVLTPSLRKKMSAGIFFFSELTQHAVCNVRVSGGNVRQSRGAGSHVRK